MVILKNGSNIFYSIVYQFLICDLIFSLSKKTLRRKKRTYEDRKNYLFYTSAAFSIGPMICHVFFSYNIVH